MVAVIDKLAGPPTEITEQISKLEKAEDKTSEDLQRLKQLRKQAGKYKGEFKREELEWSGLLEYFDEQGHPDLETFRAFRGWELTKDLPDRLDADQETKLLKQINAEYDALVKKPFKIKKSDVINWIRANALEIEEVHYHDRKNPYGPIEDEGRIVWPVDAGNEYVATWVNPLTKKEHKFEIKKVELKSGPIWYMIQDGVQQTSSDTEDQARRHANDWADDLYEDSITEASKLEWVEQEVNSLGKKVTVPTWRANAQDPLTGEFVQWEIEKQKESPTWQELGRTHNYVIYQDGEMWDDTAGNSLVEAQRYVEAAN